MAAVPNKALKLDTPPFTHCPSDAKALELKTFIHKRIPLMSGEVQVEIFLENFLPFPGEQAEIILKKLKERGLYRESELGPRWVDMPTDTELAESQKVPKAGQARDPTTPVEHSRSPSPSKRKREEHLYEPFVKILNEIAQTSVALRGDQTPVYLSGEWANTHKQAPKSKNPDNQGVFPDVSFTYASSAAEMKGWGSGIELAGQPATVSKTTNESVDSMTTSHIQSRLWLQMYTLVEIKPERDTGVLAQLATYVRQIFMEQLDRYFVLVFTLELDQIRIHLFDRSGIASSTRIDIHKAPEQFIAAIASWSCLSPSQLGWDPTIQVWSNNKAIPSYEAPMGTFSCAYDVPWIIEGFDDMFPQPSGARTGGRRARTHPGLTFDRHGQREVPDEASSTIADGIENSGSQWGDKLSIETEPVVDPREHDEAEEAEEALDVVTCPPSPSVNTSSRVSADEFSGDDEEDDGQSCSIHDPDFPARKRRWVTIRSLTIQDAKRLWGRGTIVFEVISLEDWIKRNDQGERFVIKQSWQRLPGLEGDGVAVNLNNSSNNSSDNTTQQLRGGRTLEKELTVKPYEAFVLNLAGLGSRLKEAGFVKLDGGNVDTISYIRKGVQVNCHSSCLNTKFSEPRKKKMTQSQTQSQPTTPSWIRASSNPSLQSEHKQVHPAFVNRTLARMVFKLPGVTIRDFADKIEFLEGFRGALIEHEKCYQNGIIQRDISINNIILSNGHGHLIDFDHSKLTDRLLPLNKENSDQVGMKGGYQVSEVRRGGWLQMFEDRVLCFVEEIFRNPVMAESYLLHLESHYSSSGNTKPWSFKDLWWPEEPYSIPFFGPRRAGPGYVTGTPPFMSCRLLAKSKSKVHTAIHDIESFLWAFLYMALKYSGPGAHPKKMTQELAETLDHLFSSSHEGKLDILESAENLEALLDHVSPYFEDYKVLIRDWHRVLERAHNFPAGMEYNYPHQAILRCIDQAITKLRPSLGSDLELENAVKQKRAQAQEDIKRAIRNQTTVHALSHQGNGTATSSTVPVQDIPSSDPATRPSDRLALSQTSPPRKKKKGTK